MEKKLKVNGHTIKLSSLDKVLFPESGITKKDLADYYRRIANVMLPYLRERPLSMERFPDGIGEEGFYQKEVPDYFPDWIARTMVPVESEAATQPQVVCNNAATLVYLANQGCITPHIWLSRTDDLHKPDRLIFDLDPPEDRFDLVRAAARSLRGALEDAGLVPYVMTTGSRGLHVVAPLERGDDFNNVRDFARILAEHMAKQEPERYTTETRKAKRAGRLFLDYLRNAYAQTAVAPYAVRPLPGAPVATPLEWSELDRGDLHSQSYTMGNIFRRLGQKKDPWRDMGASARQLPAEVAY